MQGTTDKHKTNKFNKMWWVISPGCYQNIEEGYASHLGFREGFLEDKEPGKKATSLTGKRTT